ncbi:MAG: aldo/keto reductase [Sedimentisphaerales bacterium]|nr:aldo/keto reductase [Sedimentisphaerales bacterium]
MKEKQYGFNRRSFLRSMSAAGLGSVLAAGKILADTNEPNTAKAKKPKKLQKEQPPQIPKRRLGKTGIEVPCLALGTMFNVVDKQIVLRKALQWGMTYWDTANSYGYGNSELGIGKFLAKNPELRKELFIATKASGANKIEDVEDRLQTSLKRMNTNYIDIYYGIHGCSDPALLTDQLKQWAQKAKERKLIKFFGFTTHTNMAQCLMAASKLDWIDAIMTSFNFRYMQDKDMQTAVDACHKAGIAIIAMKTQGQGQDQNTFTAEDKKLTEHFIKRGFTEGQAKLKVILDDKRISAVCIGRDNISHLMLNIAAAFDKTKLSRTDKATLNRYAQATASGYCAGCASNCESALPGMPCIRDIMRYLMYHNSYGDRTGARELFAQIPASTRNRLLDIDYRTAEALCPQNMPIGSFVAEAVSKLS